MHCIKKWDYAAAAPSGSVVGCWYFASKSCYAFVNNRKLCIVCIHVCIFGVGQHEIGKTIGKTVVVKLGCCDDIHQTIRMVRRWRRQRCGDDDPHGPEVKKATRLTPYYGYSFPFIHVRVGKVGAGSVESAFDLHLGRHLLVDGGKIQDVFWMWMKWRHEGY